MTPFLLMKYVPIFMRIEAAVLSLVLSMVCIGCGSLRTGNSAQRETTFDLRGLQIAAPEGRDWHHIEDEDGQHFVLLRDELADYVVLYAVTTKMERRLSSIEQLFARLNTDPALQYETLDIGIVQGVPAIRFSLHDKDDGKAYELVRQRLELTPRPNYPNYYTSTRGFMLLHPDVPDYFVTIACARTIYHGFIGSHFEQISEDFFSEFIANNVSTAAIAGTEQVAGTPVDPALSPTRPVLFE